MLAPWTLRGEPVDCITVATRLAVVTAAAVLVGPLPSAGQFTSGVNLVEVYASVTDSRGAAISGLTQADFELRENGQLQQISNFAAGEVPLSVAVAIDRSFSMAGTRLPLARSAAQAFLAELRPQDEAMILSVGSQVEVAAPLSTDRAAQRDAIIRAIDEAQPAKGRRALVLLSDGNDRYSQATAADALDRARGADVMIFPVALGPTRPPLFAELATLTGGRSYHARDGTALDDTLRTIARELRQQYLLGYAPTRAPVAGSNEWRSITVVVKKPGAQVRARDGYLVK